MVYVSSNIANNSFKSRLPRIKALLKVTINISPIKQRSYRLKKVLIPVLKAFKRHAKDDVALENYKKI